MDALVNRQLLEQTVWDSGAPSGTAAVVHRFTAPGAYFATVLHDDQAVGELELTVVERPERSQAGGAPASAHVDLSWVRRGQWQSLEAARGGPSRVAEEGHVLFSNAEHVTGYSVRVMRLGEPEAAVDTRQLAFDTRQLDGGDLFAVTLIRPGAYTVSNSFPGAEGRITVAYPTIGEAAYRPPEPAMVVCGQGGFDPASVDLQPAQGLVFRLDVPSRIVITLVQPDDGPAELMRGTRRAARWRSPGA